MVAYLSEKGVSSTALQDYPHHSNIAAKRPPLDLVPPPPPPLQRNTWNQATLSTSPRYMYRPSRGRALGPKGKPLVTGEYMSNMYPKKPTTLEVTELGDVLLSPGRFPNRALEPLWAYRMTGTFDGRANGGLGCTLEEFWQRHSSRDEIPATLSVKNGRWRVGRGRMCTLGRSLAPK